MKTKSTLLVIVAIVAGAFCITSSSVMAQYGSRSAPTAPTPRTSVITEVGRGTTTDTATNPHLQRHTAAGAATKVSAKDNGFLVTASTANAREVEDGKIGQKAATNPEVKNIAARMVADHSKANKELIDLARRKAVSLNTSGVKAQILMAPGPDFDRQLLTMLETEHKKGIADFEKEAKSGDDSDLRAYANRELPILREHLGMVQQTMRKVK